MKEKITAFITGKVNKVTMYVLIVINVIITASMNLFIFPKITAGTGMRVFDMYWFTGYSYDSASAFLSMISDAGRHVYLALQLPLDYLFIILYTALFLFITVRVYNKLDFFTALPLLIALIDICEDICIYMMLTSSSLSRGLVMFSSAMTICKSFLITIVGTAAVIHYIKTARAGKKECMSLLW